MKLLLLVAFFAFAYAQREYPIFDRPCSERSAVIRPLVKTSFNVAAVSFRLKSVWNLANCEYFQYSGTWFEVQRYQQREEAEADCVSSIYTWLFISRRFEISRVGFDFVAEEDFSRSATALLSFPDADPTLGLLNVTYYADRGLWSEIEFLSHK